MDADALIEDTTTASHNVIAGNVTTSTTTASTLSFYAKAAGRSVIQVRYGVQALTNRGQGNVDLLTGETAIIQNLGTATGTTLTATLVGSGWYRIAITTNPNDAAATQMRVQIILGNVAVGSMTGTAYTGDGYSGIYIWGAQLEAGAFPTSYIPTVASQVTRAADAASMTGANFSSWYRADEGTFYSESQIARQSSVAGTGVIDVTDGAINNLIRVFYRGNGTSGASITTGGAVQADFTPTGVLTANQTFKNAFAYKVNDFADSGNSATVVTDTAGTVPGVSQINIGRIDGLASISGHIRKIAYYPKRLSNVELQGLTTS